MELWEAGILVVGGVFLVSYMAKKAGATPMKPGVSGATTGQATALGSLGTTNMSNLTNITNTAAGQPTVYGEPLEPVMNPIVGPVTAPGFVMPRNPVPIYRLPVSPTFGPRVAGVVPVVRKSSMISTARMQLL